MKYGTQEYYSKLELLKVNNSSLDYIQLEDSELGEAEALSLAVIIENNTQLKDLGFIKNKISNGAMEIIAHALNRNIGITRFYFNDNQIDDKGFSTLAQILEQNTKIKFLELWNSKIVDEKVKALAGIIAKNNTIEILLLHACKINDEGIKVIAQAIEINTGLIEFSLHVNHIQAKGAVFLAQALQKNFTLRYLDMSSNQIGNEGAMAFAETIQKNKSLAHLRLCHDETFQAPGCNALANALKNNYTLHYFAFYHRMADKQVFLSALQTNFCLAYTDYYGDSVDNLLNDAEINNIKDLLLRNRKIHEQIRQAIKNHNNRDFESLIAKIPMLIMIGEEQYDLNTLLHIAITHNNAAAAKLIIQYMQIQGIPFNLKNAKGETVFDLASNKPDLLALLPKAPVISSKETKKPVKPSLFGDSEFDDSADDSNLTEVFPSANTQEMQPSPAAAQKLTPTLKPIQTIKKTAQPPTSLIPVVPVANSLKDKPAQPASSLLFSPETDNSNSPLAPLPSNANSNTPPPLHPVKSDEEPSNENKPVTATTKTPLNLSSIQISIEIKYKDLQFEKIPIGRGSFGDVFKGTCQYQTVAIKKVLINDSKAGEMFWKEVKLMAQLRSQYIVQLYGACIDRAPYYYIVMEYMPEKSLYDLLHYRIEITLDLLQKLQIGEDVINGIAYLHYQKIVHRDLKSQNILLEKKGEKFCAKLCDFGISKNKETYGHTSRQGMEGTIQYMAPEVFNGAPTSPPTDIYSFAIILNEIITRKIPFSNEMLFGNIALIIINVSAGKRPTEAPDCPPKLAKLIKPCWSQKPSERPPAEVIVKQIKEIKAAVESQSPSASENQTTPRRRFFGLF